ncbi:C2H2-like zinc finger protein, partial [Prunus dulcis]
MRWERLGALRGFDLNEASDPEEENEGGGGGGFDLNMLPQTRIRMVAEVVVALPRLVCPDDFITGGRQPER